MGGSLCHLFDRAGSWGKIVDIHEHAVLWAEKQSPGQYRNWENFKYLFGEDLVQLRTQACLRLGEFVLSITLSVTSYTRTGFLPTFPAFLDGSIQMRFHRGSGAR